jgi:tRNA dimethylallyltransferase
MSGRPLLVLLGPTAVGKSEVALEVGERLGGEIVSADSMQVYRWMDVGTAKPSPEDRARVPHHLIDVVDPATPFSVADYQAMALECIRSIHARGRIPLLVGGTGLYIKAVTDLYLFEAMERDGPTRRELQGRARQEGIEGLYRELQAVDPEGARRIHPNDARRVIRALEVYRATGRPISSHQATRRADEGFDLLMIGLTMERERLYSRIDSRVDRMMALGFMDEVRRLLERGYGPGLYPMRSLGYKEMTLYLLGGIGLEEAVRLLKRNTRHFAKRQITWFRPDKRIQWIKMGEDRDEGAVVADIVNMVEGLPWNT